MALLENNQLGKKKEGRTVGRGAQSIALIIFTLAASVGIEARLAYLQVIQGHSFSDRAKANRVRVISKQPERGNIFDRNGKLLATTRYPRSVYLWPMAHEKAGWNEKIGPRLSKILGVPQKEIEQKLEEAGSNSTSLVRVARDLNEAQVTALKEYETELKTV